MLGGFWWEKWVDEIVIIFMFILFDFFCLNVLFFLNDNWRSNVNCLTVSYG